MPFIGLLHPELALFSTFLNYAREIKKTWRKPVGGNKRVGKTEEDVVVRCEGFVTGIWIWRRKV
jgi:hypothetical protein